MCIYRDIKTFSADIGVFTYTVVLLSLLTTKNAVAIVPTRGQDRLRDLWFGELDQEHLVRCSQWWLCVAIY